MESFVDLRWLQPEGVSLFGTLILIFASGVTSFLTAAAGIGGGVALLAVMAVIMPSAAVIPVHGAIQIGSNASRALIMMRDVRYGIFFPFALGSFAGSLAGGFLVIQLPPATLQISLGIFVLWSAWFQPPSVASGRIAIALTGLVSSFLTMFVGATGMFVSAMLKTMNLDRLIHVATHAVCMSAQHVVKVIAFGFLGFAYGPYLPLVGVMVASAFLGTILGRKVLIGLTNERFHLILRWVLTLLAANLLWGGLASLQVIP